MRSTMKLLGALLAIGLFAPACVTAAPPPPASAPPPPHRAERVVVGATFHDVLSPYGEWFVIEPYGAVWRPYATVVGVGFVPYFTGGWWVYTDAGWAFETDWGWGWTVFHYGHWVWVEGPGWIWIPGTEWAPAWVMWRYGGGYVGWYPMPPPHVHVSVRVDWGHWVFIPSPYFTHRDFHRWMVPHHDRYRAYHAATPVDVAHGRPVGPRREWLVRDHRVTIPEGRPTGPRAVSQEMTRTPRGLPVRDARSFEQTPPGAVVRERDRDRGTPEGGGVDRGRDTRERWTQPEPGPREGEELTPGAERDRGRQVDRGERVPEGDETTPARERERDRTVDRGERAPGGDAAPAPERDRGRTVDRGARSPEGQESPPPAQVRPREERGTGGSGGGETKPSKKTTRTREKPKPPPQRGDR